VFFILSRNIIIPINTHFSHFLNTHFLNTHFLNTHFVLYAHYVLTNLEKGIIYTTIEMNFSGTSPV
jgi:hypothetical protein